MAITTEKSAQLIKTDAEPRQFLGTTDLHGRVRMASFDFTQGAANGDAGSLAVCCTLPAGRVRLIDIEAIHDAMSTGRTLDWGHAGYDTKSATVAADPDAFAADLSVATAGTKRSFVNQVIDSTQGFRLTAQINDGTLLAGKKISGVARYVLD